MSKSGESEIFGVFICIKEGDTVDEEDIKYRFGKYGQIVFVKQIISRVYINFTSKTDAENCLLDSPDPKYGEIKRGRGMMGGIRNSTRDLNKQSGHREPEIDIFSKVPEKSRSSWILSKSSDSESSKRDARNSNISPKSNFNFREDTSKYGSTSPRSEDTSRNNIFMRNKMSPNSPEEQSEHPRNFGSQRQAPEKISTSRKSKLYVSDGPPPLISVDDGPPPLLSVDDGPPPLLSCEGSPPLLMSALKPLQISPNMISKSGLLPTPPLSMRYDYKSEHQGTNSSSSHNPTLPLAVLSDGPPPLISVLPNSEQNVPRSSKNIISHTSHENYLLKYGNYLLIANIPEDSDSNELEKVLYPHTPVCLSDAEVTNIKLHLLYCLATFNTPDAAAKAAKQLNGVELRGHCLNMIRLDELVLFSKIPF